MSQPPPPWRTALGGLVAACYVGSVIWLAIAAAAWLQWLGALVALLGVLGGIAMLNHLGLLGNPAPSTKTTGPLPNAHSEGYSNVPRGGDPYA